MAWAICRARAYAFRDEFRVTTTQAREFYHDHFWSRVSPLLWSIFPAPIGVLALITYFPQPPQASKLFLMTVYGSAGYAYIGFSAYCFLLLMAHRNTPWGLQAVIASGATAALCAAIAATALCFISLFGQSSSLLCLPSGVALLAAPLFLQRLALRRRREMGDAW